ncbi:MAG: PrgI family protein [Parcubacteria group bacterium]|nr:MAG: PrgI family protein [Parcubacteria group bacterium]
MRYTVPQFIEYETKIVGPFTFGQFVFIGTVSAVCFVLYFILNNIVLFLFAIAIIMPVSFVLALLKVGGRPIPVILMNFFKFSVGSKMYIWKKKEAPIMYVKSELKKELEKKKEGDVEGVSLGIAENSQLKRIKTKIEIK